ncbi:MAG: sodium:solute symporter family protein [Synergistales bacterium]|nr:sodium:solute symporter family protein [Synergistales bacterium]
MSPVALVAPILAFGCYTLAIIVLTGRGYRWNEDRYHFYLARRNVGLFASICTFGATWMSAASLLGFTMGFYREGWITFFSSVNGWLLGLVPMCFVVFRLRATQALSLPEWVERRYGDRRLRPLTGAALVVAYIFYIVIQFKVFGNIVSRMLEIEHVFVASSLVYLFVLYTTFGGLPSVVRSDILNFALIIGGVTVAAVALMAQVGTSANLPALVQPEQAVVSHSPPTSLVTAVLIIFGWGLGVAANPQYAIRIVSARNTGTALNMLKSVPFLVGWIYLCLTAIALGGKRLLPALAGTPEETFTALSQTALPLYAWILLFLAVIAAAVSTANSQLLLAASSWCHDIFAGWATRGGEELFLLRNRVVIAVIASVALVLSFFPLPGIMILGRYSWAVVALCFLIPLYSPKPHAPKALFPVVCLGLAVHAATIAVFRVMPEVALVPALVAEVVLYVVLARRSA